MQLDSLTDWIRLLFISCHARSKNFSIVWGSCSFCLARFLSVLLNTRMVDGIHKGQHFLKIVEGNVTGREYWNGDGQCGENKWISLFVGKEGREGERFFIESYLNRLDGQESEGFASSQAELEGMGFCEGLILCSAEHPALLQVTKPLSTRSEVSLKITLHRPHTRLIKAIRNVPRGFSGLWKALKSADVQFQVVKPPAENQRALSAQQHPSPNQSPASDEGCHKEMPKVCSPCTPSLLLLLQQEYESSPEESCQWGMIFLWLLPGWEIMPCFFANCLICRAEHIGLMSNWYIPLQTADPTTEWDANLIIPHVGNRNGISLLNLFSYVGEIKNKKRCWSGLCELNTFHSPELERNELCSCCRSLTG